MITIQHACEQDWEDLWPLVHEVFASGESYPYSPETSKEDALHSWLTVPTATYIAIEDNTILGTYYLKPNQPGLGSHICNAGYMVSHLARGKGLGKTLCRHSIEEAKRLGFKAMQYNLVVSTNNQAVKLWQKMGFQIIGTVPKAFRHKTHGLVAAYIMYQDLE